MSKLSLAEWKAEWMKQLASTGGFKPAWDAGHCYLTTDVELKAEDCEDVDAAHDFMSEEESEHGPLCYCVPGVINQLVGEFSVVADDCYDAYCTTDEERVAHLEGFIGLVESCGEHDYKWYHIDLLKVELDRMKANLKLDNTLANE
jgi:hypothetical protein